MTDSLLKSDTETIADRLNKSQMYQQLDRLVGLSAADWHAYYAGVERSLSAAIARRGQHPVHATLRREREIYEVCGDEYGYVCLVLQRDE